MNVQKVFKKRGQVIESPTKKTLKKLSSQELIHVERNPSKKTFEEITMQTEKLGTFGQRPDSEETRISKPTTKADKIDALKKKQAQIEAQIKALQAKNTAQDRKRDTRLKVLIGAALLADIEKTTSQNAEAGDKQKSELKALLNRAIQRKQEREFLQSTGWL